MMDIPEGTTMLVPFLGYTIGVMHGLDDSYVCWVDIERPDRQGMHRVAGPILGFTSADEALGYAIEIVHLAEEA